jgi:hypothetical protein
MAAAKLVRSSLVALAALSGCASDSIESHPANPEIQREVKAVVENVRSETGTALYTDLRRLVAFDVFAVRQVSDLAEDVNPRLRSNAMWVLAQIQDRDHPAIMAKIDGVLRHGLDDVDLSVRYESAVGLAARGNWDVLPILIGGLEQQDSGIRFRCNEQLVATTSRDFGFPIDGSTEQRKAAVDRWKQWYVDWQKTRS